MKDCCVCLSHGSGYRCPTCSQHYCSVICCKAHKAVGCEPPHVEPSEETQMQQLPEYYFSTEDTVPPEKLELLRHSKEIEECLKNPHARDIIRAIVHSSDPTSAIASAMTDPIFIELADACLKVVESPDDDKPC